MSNSWSARKDGEENAGTHDKISVFVPVKSHDLCKNQILE